MGFSYCWDLPGLTETSWEFRSWSPDKFQLVSTSLDKSFQVLTSYDKSRQVLTSLYKVWQVSSSLDKSRQVLSKTYQVSANFSKSQHASTSLGKSKQVSASLNKSKQVLAGLDLWISVKKVFIATLKHCHLLVSCLFRSHTKENLSRLVKTSWDLSRHVDTCKDPDAKRFTESLNIFKSQSWLLIYRSQFWDSLRLVETCPGLP